jgi:hypothetical protein
MRNWQTGHKAFYSTKNGTQLIVYTCKDSTNQRWRQGL